MKYIIVTAVRNEVLHISKTIESVLNQTLLPEKWILIDDRSTDQTAGIIKGYCQKFGWIEYRYNDSVHLSEKGARIAKIITGAVESAGTDYHLLSKLDADVSFEKDFYAEMVDAFEKDEKLGIASGSLLYKGKEERNIFGNLTRGATKMYRKDCWDDIGGLFITTGWDTLDNIAANYKGWNTKALNIPFHHLKEEGRTQGYFRKYYDSGIYYGKIPYSLRFLSFKLIYRIFEKPMILSSIYTLAGFIKTRYIRKERPFPAEISKYYKKQQIHFLTNFYKYL